MLFVVKRIGFCILAICSLWGDIDPVKQNVRA